ncbi:MAG TPA: Ig-like domain-containing protein [Spirochaetota bacterium]|nr:Ig-like domain-containing protein [Spirochaetota bacterium]
MALMFSACEFNTDTLEVEWCTPVNGATGVYAGTSIEIKFSRDVNRSDAEELFILENSDEKIPGRFIWSSGKRFVFIPSREPGENGRYTITVPREIRDTDGNTMGSDFLSDFYIGDDFVNPAVVSSSPQYSSGATLDVAIDQDIAIDYSKSMNREKTQSAFSISPGVSGYFVWSEAAPGLADSRLEYRLTEPMEYGKLYRMKVTADAEDTAGNRIGTDYIVNFVTGNDTAPPEIDTIEYNDGIPGNDDRIQAGTVKYKVSKHGPIVITFTEPMDRYSVEKAVTITPSLTGYYEWHSDLEVEFNPSESFEPETLYQFAVETSCRDINGLRLASRYVVEFKTDADDSRLVKVRDVSGSYDNSAYALFGLTWPVEIEMGDAENSSYYIRIRFLSSIEDSLAAVMQKYSIFDKVLVETRQSAVDGTSSLHGSAIISDISWQDDSTVVIQISGMTNSATDIPALYRLTVTGGKTGIKDTNDNYMKEDFVIEFKEEP